VLGDVALATADAHLYQAKQGGRNRTYGAAATLSSAHTSRSA